MGMAPPFLRIAQWHGAHDELACPVSFKDTSNVGQRRMAAQWNAKTINISVSLHQLAKAGPGSKTDRKRMNEECLAKRNSNSEVRMLQNC